jgi:hypothetical protein
VQLTTHCSASRRLHNKPALGQQRRLVQQPGQPLMPLRRCDPAGGLRSESSVASIRQQQQLKPGDGVQVGLTVGFVLLSCQPERMRQSVVDVAGCDVAGLDAEVWWW